MSDYYTNSGDPANDSDGVSAVIRAENAAIAAGFAKIAGYTGNGGKIVAINAGGTAQETIATTGTGSVVRGTSPSFTTSVVSASTTLAVFNTTATTINAFGGTSTALNIGNASGTNTILGATNFSQTVTLIAPVLGTPASGNLANCTFPTLNQNTTGTAAGLSTILDTAHGGTGIAYFTAAGPTQARVYTFPDAAATMLYSGGALGTPSSATLTNATGLPIGGITMNTARLLGRTTAAVGAAEEITVGSGLSLSAGSLTATGIVPTANTQTISADLVLTSASAQLQVITPNAAGLSVQLPDATTMTNLAFDKFIIKNAGTQVLGIRDGSATPGTLLRVILPSGTARISCASIATAAGVWPIDGVNLGHMLPINERTLVSATPTASYYGGNTNTIQLSSTLVIYVAQVTTTLYLTAHNLATGTIGTTVSVTSWVSGQPVAGFAISATAGVVFTFSSATYTGVAFTVSGTTITAGSATTKAMAGSITLVDSGTTRFQSQIAQLGGSTFVLPGCSNGASPFQPSTVIATVSGTTITFGTETSVGGTIATTTPTWQEVIARSATEAIMIFNDSAASLVHVRHISVSGTTPTYDSTISRDGGAATPLYSNIVLMGTDEWWMVLGQTTDARVFRITVSGVTLTMPASTALTAPSAFTFIGGDIERAKPLIKVDATTAVLFYNNDTTNTSSYKITYSGAFSSTQYAAVAGMNLQTATNAAVNAVVAGTVTHGIILNVGTTTTPPHVAVVSLSSGNPILIAAVPFITDNTLYAVFYNNRLYLISGWSVWTDVVCIDLTTGQELSRQSVRKITRRGSNSLPNIELCGARLVMSGVDTNVSIGAGQRCNVLELV